MTPIGIRTPRRMTGSAFQVCGHDSFSIRQHRSLLVSGQRRLRRHNSADLPVICVETRHMRAVPKAQINKPNRNDARGIAQMMRAGLC